MTDHSKTIAEFEKKGEAVIRKWLTENIEETSDRVHYRLAQQWIQNLEFRRLETRTTVSLIISIAAIIIAVIDLLLK